MQQTSTDSRIIIILVQHPVFGAMLVPYTACNNTDGTVSLLEQAFHVSGKALAGMSQEEQKTIEIGLSYSDKRLMAVYSKEKTVSAFLKKVTEDTVKRTIRPFIEKKLVEMVEVLRRNNIPLYQNMPGNKMLYEHSRYLVSPNTTEVSFHFEADETAFKYGVVCTRGGEDVSLLDKKPVTTLVSSPAILMLGNELHVFRDIQSSRIIPFTNKPLVSVDISQMDKYLENVVLPIIRFHEVSSTGLPIVREERSLTSQLSLENNIYEKPVLQLIFAYGDKVFYPGKNSVGKYAFIRETNGRKVIHYFYRNTEREDELIALLKEAGLRLFTDSYYAIREDWPIHDLSEWISRNKKLLTDNFQLLNAEKKADYCLDEISVSQDISEDNDWFELKITVTVGEFRIPFIRFRNHILEGNREFVLPDGRIILLPEEWFIKYADVFEFSEKSAEALKLKRSLVGVVSEFFSDKDREKFVYQPKEKVPVPSKMKATLRNYQQDGFNWMLHLNRNKLGGCLADDMGLGKTLQTLTLLQYIYMQSTAVPSLNISPDSGESGQLSLFGAVEEQYNIPASLIVMPTSLLHNWRREIRKFTALSEFEYSGGSHLKNEKIESVFGRFHLVITSYGIMRNNVEELSRYNFEYIVLDESQNIKNSDSLTFKAAIQLRGNHKLILTGTPIENSLKDLWSQFRFLQPDLLGSESYYQKRYITPVKQGNINIQDRLSRLISPFILRRSKQEVAPELPSLMEEYFYCGMTDGQKEIYQREKNGLRNILLEQTHKRENRNNLTVLNGITLLRQLACHPAMVYPDFTGSSGKLEDILAMFETLQSEGHKVLIFSSFVKHLELIGDALSKREWKYSMLTGSTLNREKEIEQFNNSIDVKAFLISLKAGGVGLNLTQADYVFIIDPWWNPAAEMQAISRAHRIGQDKQVIAYRFITEGSIEEKIIRLQEGKRKLSETFINDSNPFAALTDAEWMELLKG